MLYSQEVAPPTMSYVSINPYTNEVTASWYKSTSANIAYTRLHYVYDETALIKAKTITDIPSNEDKLYTFKTDSIAIFSHEAQDGSLSFAVDAYSTNRSNSTSLKNYHSTIHLRHTIQNCPLKIQLNWNAYMANNAQILSYKIIEIQDGKETILINLPSSLLTHQLETNNKIIRQFFIEALIIDAKGQQKISRSNMLEINTPVFIAPEYIHIHSTQIDKNNRATLNFSIDENSSLTTYTIAKTKESGEFYSKDTIHILPQSYAHATYTDTSEYKKNRQIEYKILAKDNCYTTLYESAKISLFTITVSEKSGQYYTLEWKTPTLWTQGIEEYAIYRIINGTEELVTTVPASETSYTDNIENSATKGESYCYRVEAKSAEPEKYTSISNTFCIDKNLNLLIPNAVNPNSNIEENREFKPKVDYFSGEYHLQIYDRYGLKVFDTKNIEEGWNATYKYKPVNQGSYHYKIQIKTTKGEKKEYVGNLMVIYN